MTISNDLWERKIKAFLFTPPDIALFPDGKAARVKRFVAAALGIKVDDVELPPEIEQADQLAAGPDIPPFILQADKNCFRNSPHIVHPLSGENYPLPQLVEKIKDISPEMLETHILKAIEAIRREIEQSQSQQKNDTFHKRLFLALWRKLSDLIPEQENSDLGPKLGGLWDLLPADPRIPSHSVWDHMSVASAIAGAIPEPTLVIFTIGSVQEFVSTARRTQDFWMGSFLLSYLTWEAIKIIADECGPDCLLFPSLKEQPFVDLWLYKKGISAKQGAANEEDFLRHSENALQIANFPNMFTAIVPRNIAKDLMEKAKAALLARWKKIGHAVKSKVEKTITANLEIWGGQGVNDQEWQRIWDRQLKDLFDRLGIFWVACPWGEDVKAVNETYLKAHPNKSTQYKSFQKILKTIEQSNATSNVGIAYPMLSAIAASALTTRKNLRNFNQEEEPDWKCSLCGLRQALRPEFSKLKKVFNEKSDETLLRSFWESLSQLPQLRGRIRRGDRLCAICLVKRLALEAYFKDRLNFDHRLFPSTATIAVASFKEQIIEQLDKEIIPLKEYVEKVRSFLEKHKIFFESSVIPRLNVIKDNLSKERDLIDEFLVIDGEWLFEESFEPEKLKREYKIDIDERSRREAVQSLLNLLKVAKELKIVSPFRYYAIIAMDGDKMSHWVSGHKAPPLKFMVHSDATTHIESILGSWSFGSEYISRSLGPSLHMALSTALKNFALTIVPEIVERQHLGKLIYAGGDDVLAFVPVQELLPVMNKLRLLFQGINFDEASCEDKARRFNKRIRAEKGFAELWFRDPLNQNNGRSKYLLLCGGQHTKDKELFEGPTVSMGAAIVHESYPLIQAVHEAFAEAMKKHAKDRLGRNAFAIHLIKRAGGPLCFGMKWSCGKDTKQSAYTLDNIKKLASHIQDESLSTRLAYDMEMKRRGLEGSLPEILDHEQPWWYKAQFEELYRLTKQHTTADKKIIKQHLHDLLETIYDQIGKRIIERKKENENATFDDLEGGWKVLTNLLLFVRFFAKGN